MFRSLIALAAPVALAACATVPAPETAATVQATPQTGIVSAADPRAAAAGYSMLERGGNATDAAIATMLALTVVEPQSSGIGGGGFMVRGTADGTVETLDGRETAPSGADERWFFGPDGERQSYGDVVLTGLSIGVPGNLALAAEAHAKYGELPWADLFQPAIALARDGWTISERFHRFLDIAEARAARTPAGRTLFYDDAGERLPVGARVDNPALADTLEALARQGADWLYAERAGAELAAVARQATPRDGGMTAADVRAYEAKWREPVCGEYRAYRICGMGPPSSGATTVFAILKQLEGFDMAALGPDNATSWHLFAESQRLAYADRELYIGDSDYVTVPVSGMVDAEYLAARGSLIDADSRMEAVEAGDVAAMALADGDEPEERGTSHFAVIDREGTAISYTSTIEGAFGSGHMYGGFYLNNELTDFSFSPVVDGRPVANRVEGGKRPRSSMSPTVVYDADGNLVLAIGAAGGGTIPVQVAKALIGFIDWDMTAQQAIALPGMYSPGDTMSFEEGHPILAHRAELEALGHTVTTREMPFKANAVAFENGRWTGAADPRSEGAAVGE